MLLFLSMLSGILSISNHVTADSTEVIDQVSLTVPIACTMAGTGTTHTATLNPGTYSGASGSEYENGIGKTTLTAICNDDNGFSIYAIGYTGNSYDSENHTKLVGSNTGGAITTKAYASGDVASNWSMKLTKVTDTSESYNPQNLTIQSDTEGSFDAWHSIPSEYAKIAQYKANTGSSTTDTTLGVKLETTYAAYIASIQPADTYIGQVKYTMVHPYNAIKPTNVDCNPNAATIDEAVCMQDFAGPNGEQIASTMTLEQQYTLKDKRDDKAYTIARYQQSDIAYITIIDGYIKRNQASLYDMSGYLSLPPEWQAYADSCTGPSFDTCDESLHPQLYGVWMTQNLDLDIDSQVAYTNEDTDIGYNVMTGQYDSASWIPLRSTYPTTTTQIPGWCNGGTWEYDSENDMEWCVNNNTPESYDPGDYYWNGAESDSSDWRAYFDSCTLESKTVVCDQSLNPIQTYVSTNGISQYHLGNYYNWPAAVATNNSEEYRGGEYVEQSICPAGWTLPRYGEGIDTFYSLWDQYGFSENSINSNDKLWQSPLYIAHNGVIQYGVLLGMGSYAAYWSPYVNHRGAAGISMSDTDGEIDTDDVIEYHDGLSIRCMARPVVIPSPAEHMHY